MKSSSIALGAVAIGLFLSSPEALRADTFQFASSFSQDSDVARFDINFLTVGSVICRTWSYSGGTAANGWTILPGGFDPSLFLFDSAGTLIYENQNGPPDIVPVDPEHGYTWDAYLPASLNAGWYTLFLTEQDNTPKTFDLKDGFVRAGQGNFTSGLYGGGQPGGFWDLNGHQRTANWAVEIVGADSAKIVASDATLPEPSVYILLAVALCPWFFVRGRKRRTN